MHAWAEELSLTVKASAHFLSVSPSLVYAYVERRQIPSYRMMGRSTGRRTTTGQRRGFLDVAGRLGSFIDGFFAGPSSGTRGKADGF